MSDTFLVGLLRSAPGLTTLHADHCQGLHGPEIAHSELEVRLAVGVGGRGQGVGAPDPLPLPAPHSHGVMQPKHGVTQPKAAAP
jgi:hypothetical protein